MTGSHPPSLVTLAKRVLERDASVSGADRILVAVSGGPDSMALLHVLAQLRARVGHDVVAHGVDHGLRREASAELDLAERLARELGVPFSRTTVVVPQGGNLQARARTARFEALREAASRGDATRIATAHHADDRAETVVMRLLRGSGPSGLGVLPPLAGDLVRPFIRARKAEITAYVARRRLVVALDPSNASRRFTRVRVRTELMPLLESLSPAIVTHLCALADQLRGEAPESHAFRLPRATQEALRELARSRAGEVLLPHGILAKAVDLLPSTRGVRNRSDVAGADSAKKRGE